ncbi:MAG TPA: thiol-disulfide oxidoreductase DCC family protein [Candidatus Limnocylindrales bacterium]|nr:thiol-disulfide oxidoreductase DCC family protein [Candidatus Limnocylindrales bacterium]
MDQAIVLFDGVCNFCNASVNFVMDRDPEKHIRFAPLQSEAGQRLLKKFNLSPTALDTLILIEGEKFYTRSAAALRIAKRLQGLWPLLYIFIVVPPFIRDAVYDFIARNRYSWFGKTETCRVPTPELKERFLE